LASSGLLVSKGTYPQKAGGVGTPYRQGGLGAIDNAAKTGKKEGFKETATLGG